MVGNNMRRGISGGQKKQVTTGEMLVGPSTTLFMDEISTGLDSSTTYQIVKCLKQIIHVFQTTLVISLLQPAPETFDLFDDVILICEGEIVYHGPRDSILEFFEMMGFKCPERKGVADFLQEVTSRKDQMQYWFNKKRPYHPVDEFSEAFKSFHMGKDLHAALLVPYDKSKSHPAALVKKEVWDLKDGAFQSLLRQGNSSDEEDRIHLDLQIRIDLDYCTNNNDSFSTNRDESYFCALCARCTKLFGCTFLWSGEQYVQWARRGEYDHSQIASILQAKGRNVLSNMGIRNANIYIKNTCVTHRVLDMGVPYAEVVVCLVPLLAASFPVETNQANGDMSVVLEF